MSFSRMPEGDNDMPKEPDDPGSTVEPCHFFSECGEYGIVAVNTSFICQRHWNELDKMFNDKYGEEDK